MTEDLFDVRNRVVVITGGLGQLGRQFSLALADRGAKVAIFDRRVDEGLVVERFGQRRGDDNLLFLSVDITQRRSLEAALAQVNALWGTPQALINNAALDSPPQAPAGENGPFETYPESSWDEVMRVNAKGVFLCGQVLGGEMAAAGRGSIVDIWSTYGLVSPGQRIYESRRTGGATLVTPGA